MEHVSKAIDPNAVESSVSTSLISSVNAIKLLRRKILFLIDIFEKSKEVRETPEFRRRLNQIGSQMEVLDSALKLH